jgi:hypothetical protein
MTFVDSYETLLRHVHATFPQQVRDIEQIYYFIDNERVGVEHELEFRGLVWVAAKSSVDIYVAFKDPNLSQTNSTVE